MSAITIAPETKDYDGFPVLDFTFQNRSRARALITRIELDVRQATIDETPALEYSLECHKRNLVIAVRNYGWGPALEFSGVVERSVFGAALREPVINIQADAVPPAKAGSARMGLFSGDRGLRGDPSIFSVVDRRELDLDKLPGSMVHEGTTSHARDRYQIPKGGISHLPAEFLYRSTDGRQLTDSVDVRRIQRGAYDWRKIMVVNGGFEYVEYDAGVRYSLMPPSCRYHFMLDPDAGAKVLGKSVAHEILPEEFERIWLIVASTKSAIYDVRCVFRSGDDVLATSVPISLHVWSPRNGPIQSTLGMEVSDTSFPRDRNGKSLELPEYDVSRQQRTRTHTWGY